ncbi:MAG: beta-lactamase family protein [Candidatus Sericytochromatia bacterium]|nr:beta-lactamase family protein [Candidatus Tanganyikabacteria bacterium]
MRCRLLVLAALALSGCAGPARREALAPGDRGALAARLEAFIARQMRDHRIESLSLAIVDGAGVVHEAGYGLADRDKGLAADAHTRYCVGSVTKLFTAAAVARLAEDGRVDLDRPLGEYLPEFKMRSRFPGAQAPTLRAVLAHQGGLPTDRLAGIFGKAPGRYQDLPLLLREDYLSTPPWTVTAYSNVGYTLLGNVVESVTGVPYPQYISRTLLSPLGMHRSNFDPARPAPARPYHEGAAAWEPRLRDVPAGGLYTTSHDLGRFLRMVLGGGELGGKRVLSEAMLAEMLRPQNTGVPLDFDLRVGLAWHLLPADGGGRLFAHAGKTINYVALAGFDPRARVGVAVMSSSRSALGQLEAIAREALALARETSGPGAEPGAAPSDRAGASSGDPPGGAPGGTSATAAGHPPGAEAGHPPATETGDPAADLAVHQGAYATVAGLARLEARGNTLRFRAAGLEGEALPGPDGAFELRLLLLGFIPWQPAELSAVRGGFADVAGRHVLVGTSRGMRVYAGERIAPVDIPEAWRARVGRYAAAVPEGDYPLFRGFELAEEAGFLVWRVTPLETPQVATLPLLPVDAGAAVLAGSGRNLGETVRAEHGPTGEELHYSGYRLIRQAM